MNNEALNTGNYYHIYTHAVGGRHLFKEADNYDYFLHQYDKYISPVADTFVWALMPNHVHFLIRVKASDQIPVRVPNPDRDGTFLKISSPEMQLSKLFNGYAQAFNKWQTMRGTLFERPFKRKHVDNIHYLKQLILYIHNNPVHHGFCSHPLEYPWTSYLTCVSLKPTKLNRNKVIGWFDDIGNFKTKHGEYMDWNDLEQWLQMKA